MQLVTSDSRHAPAARPTWTRLALTLLVGVVCLGIATVSALAQPAHLTKGLQLVDEITTTEAVIGRLP